MYGVNYSGGDNRTHNTLERADRIDSFSIARDFDGDMIVGGVLIQYWYEYDCGDNIVLSIGGGRWKQRIAVETIENASNQQFFICPYCLHRYRFLYFSRRAFRCRHCAKLNYRSQQRTKDVTNYAYDGMRYIKRKLDWEPPFAVVPATFPAVLPEKPPGMHWATFEKIMRRFRRYQKRYEAESVAQMLSILGKYHGIE